MRLSEARHAAAGNVEQCLDCQHLASLLRQSAAYNPPWSNEGRRPLSSPDRLSGADDGQSMTMQVLIRMSLQTTLPQTGDRRHRPTPPKGSDPRVSLCATSKSRVAPEITPMNGHRAVSGAQIERNPRQSTPIGASSQRDQTRTVPLSGGEDAGAHAQTHPRIAPRRPPVRVRLAPSPKRRASPGCCFHAKGVARQGLAAPCAGSAGLGCGSWSRRHRVRDRAPPDSVDAWGSG